LIIAQETPEFLSRVDKGIIENEDITEASGLAVSLKNPGILWTHNDSGDENRIFAIDTNGSHIGQYYLDGIENRDWEDLAVGRSNIDNESYIFIGDIGDNDEEYNVKYVYFFPEPEIAAGDINFSYFINDYSTIEFTYPDGVRDAETLMFDSETEDIYIIGKRDSKVRLYRIAYPYPTNTVQAELVEKISFTFDPEEDVPSNYITGGDISLSGEEILLKTYNNIYYWKREAEDSILETLLLEPITLPYRIEPQGEAICWRNDTNNGYYTISEENITVNGVEYPIAAHLYYYPRKSNITSLNNLIIENKFSLFQNYPNPFNPVTTIKYSIPAEVKDPSTKVQNVSLKVYDQLGREVAVLLNQKQNFGNYEMTWDASEYTSGIYYYKLTTGNISLTKKMILIK
jgi:hypothetical protein